MDRAQLIERIAEVLRGDGRVRAAWLSGSLGRGAGDEFSDVDIVIAVDEGDRQSLVAGWDEIAASIAPIVLTQRFDGGSITVFNHVTAGWLRFDVSVATPADMSRRTATTLRVLFDDADLTARLRPAGDPLLPSGPRVAALTNEFMRVLGLLPVVIGRGEHVVGASGAGLLRTLVIQLMVEDVAVEDRGGALRLRGLLPDDRLAAIEALPAIEATRESVIAVHLACAQLFLPLARDLATRTGVSWPDALDTAMREHIYRELGIEVAG